MSGRARVVVAWVGVVVGVVLLLRLVAQVARAAGYGAAWLDDVVLSEVVSGLRLSLVDIIIGLVALVGVVLVLVVRRGRDRSGAGADS